MGTTTARRRKWPAAETTLLPPSVPSLPLNNELLLQDVVTTTSFFVPTFQYRHGYRQISSLLIFREYLERLKNPALVIYRRLSTRRAVNE
jgi:hypothetical protein